MMATRIELYRGEIERLLEALSEGSQRGEDRELWLKLRDALDRLDARIARAKWRAWPR